MYSYKGCDSCRKALQWLGGQGIAFENLPIRETPPSVEELESMLGFYQGELKKLFNVSGQDYRSLGMKDRLPTMSQEAAIRLLSENGNLIKRPFAIAKDAGRVGFKPAEWEERFGG